MNENEIDRIAAAANALRPDWPLASLRTLLNKPEIAKRPRRDVAVALAWVACEAASKTPARVLEAGPWWTAANAEGNKVRTSYDLPCPEHPDQTLPCRKCAAARVPAPLAKHHLTQARAELTHTKANLCPCGVARNLCAEHSKPEPTTAQEASDE